MAPIGKCHVHPAMFDVLEWYGAIAAVIAAATVASDLGRRITGWAFVLFVTSSLSLLVWGFFGEDADGIGWQNVCLLFINGLGVYRYLLHPGGKETEPEQKGAG